MSSPYAPQTPYPPYQPGMQPMASAPAPGAYPMPQPGMPQPMMMQPMMPPQGMPQGMPNQMMPQGMQPAPMQPQGGWSPLNTTCPPGLESLMPLDHLFVNQKVELLEAFIGWETQNKYNVLNARNELVFYVAEDSGICSRFCLGSYRSCEFHVVDGSMREVLRMTRPLRCDNCCCPCCLQELEVYSGGMLLGSVVQEWSLWRPSFSIRNASGETVLMISGPLLKFCVDVTFKVKSADGRHTIGKIAKKWSGFGREIFTDADNFGINFPGDLDVKIKAVLLGACLLIDFMYFEKEK